MTDQEFQKKWAASKDPFGEWIMFFFELLAIMAGIVFLLSAGANFDNMPDAIFRLIFGAALAIGFGVMAFRHYAELKLARRNLDAR